MPDLSNVDMHLDDFFAVPSDPFIAFSLSRAH